MSYMDDIWCAVMYAADKAEAKQKAIANGMSEDEAEKAAEKIAEEQYCENVAWHSRHQAEMQ